MAKQAGELKLGKGVSFVKSHIKRLPQEDETWEVDFRAIPKPIIQAETSYIGMVISLPDGFLLADEPIRDRPSVNDLARLLANALRRPLIGLAHRPGHLHLRGHPQWREIFPHLKDLGIEVKVQQELPQIEEAYKEFLKGWRQIPRLDMVKPTPEQLAVETLFPTIAKWINEGYGRVEIGNQEGLGFVAMALEDGGLVFEDERTETLAEALAGLETCLRDWFEEHGMPASMELR